MHTSVYDKTGGWCCFNHAIGLPEKNGKKMPLFDYQKILLDSLLQTKYIWLKKSTGIGATTLFLRWMAWLCLKDDNMRNKEMAIVVGPNLDLAIGLINKIKMLFLNHGITFDTKQTQLILNNCLIKAYPSNHLDALRSRTDLKMILCDEADYFEPGERAILRDALERYIAKSNPWIILVSTPSTPYGLFAQMEQEHPSIYKRITMDYTYGLDRIYSRQEIDHARKSPSFAREYECRYIGEIGSCFNPQDINKAEEEGRTVDYIDYDAKAPKSIGVDPGFGSSKFAIVITQMINYRIEIIYAKEVATSSIIGMLRYVDELRQRYYNTRVIYVDGANPEYVHELKALVGEDTNPNRWKQYLQKVQKSGRNNILEYMRVVPVSFGVQGKEMLGRTQWFVEGQLVAIPPAFTDLLAQMRMATTDQNGNLDKTRHSLDLLDALRLALLYYEPESG